LKFGLNKKVVFFVCLAFSLGVNLYFRIFPVYFPQLKNQAREKVENDFYQKLSQEFAANSANYSPWIKEDLRRIFIEKYKKLNKREFKKAFAQEYNNLKDKYQDPQHQTYLMSVDCWHWARYVENILKHGYPGDKIIKNKQYDTMMLAPLGAPLPWERFLFYFSAWLYRLFCLFKPVALYTFLFYLPLIFVFLFLLFFYLFCFSYAGNLGALVSTLFFGLSPQFIYRSCAGYFDKDILSLFFPLLIIWTYLKAYSAESLKIKIWWLAFCGFWVGVFCSHWMQWWFIFLIIVMYEVFSLLNCIIYRQFQEEGAFFRKHLFSLSLFLLFSIFWVVLFNGIEPLTIFFVILETVLFLNSPITGSLWPNVYATVVEFQAGDPLKISITSGGIFLVLISLVSFVLIMLWVFYKKKHTKDYQTIIILFIWLVSMYLASLKGIRFAVFFIFPLSITLGWLIGKLFEFCLNKKKTLDVLAVLVLAFFLIIQCVNNAQETAEKVFPLMNDVWYNVLLRLQKETPPDAVINSWWDFGAWFKTVAKRKVIFDGQSQNSHQAYWMARVLLTDKEEEAVAILRMLNNGGDQAFQIIDGYLHEPLKSILLLKKVILLPKEEAKKLLLNHLPINEVEKIMALLFVPPKAEAYFVTDYYTTFAIRNISFLGNWDFVKVYLLKNINKKTGYELLRYLVDLGVAPDEAKLFYQEAWLLSKTERADQWVTNVLSFKSTLLKGKNKGDLVFFDNGMVYSLSSQQIWLYSEDNSYQLPRSLFIWEENKLKEIDYPQAELNYSILLFKDKTGNYQALVLSNDLAHSLLVRLYFLEGKGLKHFIPVMDGKEKEKENYIRVFKIVWD